MVEDYISTELTQHVDNTTSNVTSPLDQIPLDSPYRSRIEQVYTTYPIMALHDLPIALFESGHLPNATVLDSTIVDLSDPSNAKIDWFILETSIGKIFAHRTFLEIQDDFNSLEPDGTEQWNATRMLEAFKTYLITMEEYRNRHDEIFTLALEKVPNEEREKIRKEWDERKKNTLKFPDVVAIPFYNDNPQLWDSFYQLPAHLREELPDHFKIASNNLVLASIEQRKNHDYSSFAASEVRSGKANSMEDRLLATARHEGSHWATDKLVQNFLGIGYSVACPTSEGLASVVGNDGRALLKDAPPLSDFLSDPMTPGIDMSYKASPKFYKALFKLVQQKKQLPPTDEGEKEAWARIEASMLEIGLEMYENPEMQIKSSNEKMAIFLDRLINKSEIDRSELTNAYTLLN